MDPDPCADYPPFDPDPYADAAADVELDAQLEVAAWDDDAPF